MPNRPPACRYASRAKDAVAEVGLGGRRKAGDRAARREARHFAVGHVRRMDDAPALVDVRLRQQPLDRPHAAPRVAIVDFARLLGGMDVDRRIGRREPHDLAELFRRDRAQAVRRDAQRVAVGFRLARQRVEQPLERVRAVHEAALQRRRCDAAEVAVRIENGQQRQSRTRPSWRPRRCATRAPPGPRTACRADRDARSGIRRPTRSPPWPSRRRPARRSLRTRRHRVDRPRRTSPGATSRTCRHAAADGYAGAAGDRALERMRMQVRHRGDDRPGQPLVRGSVRAALDALDAAGVVDDDRDAASPIRRRAARRARTAISSEGWRFHGLALQAFAMRGNRSIVNRA